MSLPPQGGWPPPQPGPQSPNQPHSGPPPGYQPYPGQQPYPAQDQWQHPPPPPQKSGGATKWFLVAIAALLVAGVTIGATLLFTRHGDGPSTPPTSDDASDIASANDTGPVKIITEEPTCGALNGINRTVADVQANGWGAVRNSLGPVSGWTAEQRNQVQAVATAMRNASDQMVALARQTPHRIMRELYEQYIAYGRMYVNRLDSYQPADNSFADVNVSIGNAMLGICNTIEYGSARRSVALSIAAEPTALAPVGSPDDATRFLSEPNAVCTEWIERERAFITDTAAWEQLDPDIPGSQWTPQQQAVQTAALAKFTSLAEATDVAGRESGNSVLEDIAGLTSLYLRAYASSGVGYVRGDSWLSYTAARLNNTVARACDAATS
jgi:hypothetical protein